MVQRVLFVDDEERVLQGLKRILQPMNGQWEMTFATNGPDALRILEETDTDVLVSDMRMPGMDGAEVLTRAMRISPATVRIALSGESDPAMRLRTVATAHQYLTKPCDPDILKDAIARSCSARDRIAEPRLRELVTGVSTLPCSEAAYERLIAELARTRPELEQIAAVVASDISMSAKALQLVNSSFFIAGRSIVSPRRAVLSLGVEPFRSLIQLRVLRPGTAHDDLRDRALATREQARLIAITEGWSDDAVQDAETAALLQDIGELVLGALSRQVAAAILPVDLADWAAMHERTMEANHAAVGASLLTSWGIPEHIVNAVRDHHSAPQESQSFDLAMLVRVADAIARGGGWRRVEPQVLEQIVPSALHDHLDLWRRAAASTERAPGTEAGGLSAA